MKAQVVCLRIPDEERPTLARLSRELAEIRECQEALKELERRLLAEIARQRVREICLAQTVARR